MYLISPNFPEVGEPNIEIKLFPDGDSYCRINDISKCQGEDVSLFHRLYPKQNTAIFNAAQLLHTLKRVGARTSLIAPYMPYARQDKTFLMGESLSAQVLCKLLADFGVSRLVTIDCHFLKKEGDPTEACTEEKKPKVKEDKAECKDEKKPECKEEKPATEASAIGGFYRMSHLSPQTRKEVYDYWMALGMPEEWCKALTKSE